MRKNFGMSPQKEEKIVVLGDNKDYKPFLNGKYDFNYKGKVDLVCLLVGCLMVVSWSPLGIGGIF